MGQLRDVQRGDLILRMGTGMDSLLIKQAGGGRYSHIGMVVQTQPEVIIIHATTDDDPERLDQVLLTPAAVFLAPKRATAYAQLRPLFLSQEQIEQMITGLRAQLGQPFVLASEEADHLYCTTLIQSALAQQRPAFKLAWQTVTAPVFKGRYLFPDAFLAHVDMQLLQQQDLGH
ncbi:MAG: hypothetical protein KA214_09925 [Neisseriaceae bacterium]|nr:hypothetical protein [Neisseriaceae bacterium]